MRLSFVHRVLLAIGPAVILTGLVVLTIWGENGLLARYALERELADANLELGRVQAENQRLIRQLELMDTDPVVLERMVADELGWAPEGSKVFRFEEGR